MWLGLIPVLGTKMASSRTISNVVVQSFLSRRVCLSAGAGFVPSPYSFQARETWLWTLEQGSRQRSWKDGRRPGESCHQERGGGGGGSNGSFWSRILFLGIGTGLGVLLHQKESTDATLTSSPGSLFPNVQARNASGPPRSYNFIADVVENTADSVVYIEIKDNRRVDYFTGSPMMTSNGSGFIVDSNGLILTNAHVVVNKPSSTVMVKLYDGRLFNGKVEDIDTHADLATIRIAAKDLPTMKLGCSCDVRPGEWVVAMGSPLSLSNTITAGVISSINRGSNELGLRGKDMEYLQTDAAITFGNSGGPLVNLEGEAIGVNAMKVTAGISFAIPIDYAKEFLERAERRKQELRRGRVAGPGEMGSTRRYMGITMLTLTPDIIYELQMKHQQPHMEVSHGVLVWKVTLGSPAYHAGLQPGDIVTHINKKPVRSSGEVHRALECNTPEIILQVVRGNQHLTAVVHPEDHNTT